MGDTGAERHARGGGPNIPTPAGQPRRTASWPLRYTVAAAAVLLCLALRVALDPVLGQASRFMLFLPALILSSWYGGAAVGLFALALSCILGPLFIVPPRGTWLAASWADILDLAAYIGAGLVVVGAQWAQQRSAARTADARAEQTRQTSLRTTAEADLDAAREALALFIDAVTDYALIMVDTDGRIASWNAGAQRLKGWTADEAIGRPTSLLYTDEDAAAGKPARLLDEARRAGRVEDIGVRRRKDGSTFVADVIITPIHDPTGQLRGYAKVTRDTTEQARANADIRALSESLERRVQERTAQLQEANDQLEAFTRSVSHDLRAPVRSMEAFATILRDDFGDALGPAGREHAARICRAATRMDRLITDLLEYSRLSRAEIAVTPVSLQRAVADAAAFLDADLRAAGAALAVEPPLPDVMAHGPTLVRVVANLISNAAKFVPPGTAPRITIGAGTTDGLVRVEVRDNGIGIDPADQQLIFRPFHRLHGEEAYPGTGVGLAIVRRAVERMGGRTGVDSAPGRGSTFWFELPAAAPAATRAKPKGAAP